MANNNPGTTQSPFELAIARRSGNQSPTPKFQQEADQATADTPSIGVDSSPFEQAFLRRLKSPSVSQQPAQQAPVDDDSFGTNLLQGIEQGSKSLAAGAGYAAADIGSRFSTDDVWATKLKMWAEDYKASAPEADNSVGQFLGSLIPSTIPSALAIGAAAASGGTALPAIAAWGAAGGLGLSSVGHGMMEYDAYKQSIGEVPDPDVRLAVGGFYGFAELAAERIGLSKLSKGILPGGMKTIMKGDPALAEKAAKSWLGKYAGTAGGKNFLKSLAKGSTIEGIEEGATEIAQQLTDLTYQNKEDWTTVSEFLGNVGSAALGGALMGTGLGAMSYKAQDMANKQRRQANGRVIVAQDKNTGEALEIIAQNKETGMFQAMTPAGEVVEVGQDAIGEYVTLTPDQFSDLLKDKLDQATFLENEQRAQNLKAKQEAEERGKQFIAQFARQDEEGNTIVEEAAFKVPGGDEIAVTIVEFDPNDPSIAYVVEKDSGTKRPVPVSQLSDRFVRPVEEVVTEIIGPLAIAATEPTLTPITKGEKFIIAGQEALVVGVNPEQRIATLKIQSLDDSGNAFFETIDRPFEALEALRQITEQAPPPAPVQEAEIPIEEQPVSGLNAEFTEDGQIKPAGQVKPAVLNQQKVVKKIADDEEISLIPTSNGYEVDQTGLTKKKATDLAKKVQEYFEDKADVVVEDRTPEGELPDPDFRVVVRPKTKADENQTKASTEASSAKQPDTKDQEGKAVLTTQEGKTSSEKPNTNDRKAEAQPSQAKKAPEPEVQRQGDSPEVGSGVQQVPGGQPGQATPAEPVRVPVQSELDETQTESNQRQQPEGGAGKVVEPLQGKEPAGDKAGGKTDQVDADTNPKSTPKQDVKGQRATEGKSSPVGKDSGKPTPAARAKKKRITKEEQVNQLIDQINEVNGLSFTQFKKAFRLRNDLKKAFRSLGYTVDEASHRMTVYDPKTGKKIRKFADKTLSETSKDPNFQPLKARPKSVQVGINQWLDLAEKQMADGLNPTKGISGIYASDSAINNTIQEIRKGVNTRRAQSLLDNLQRFVEDETIPLTQGSGYLTQVTGVPFDEYITGLSSDSRDMAEMSDAQLEEQLLQNPAFEEVWARYGNEDGSIDWDAIYDDIKNGFTPEILNLTPQEQSTLYEYAQERSPKAQQELQGDSTGERNEVPQGIQEDTQGDTPETLELGQVPFKRDLREAPILEGTDETNQASRLVSPFVPEQKTRVSKAIDEIKRNWENAPEVVVWEGLLDFMVANPTTLIKNPHGVTAWYDPNYISPTTGKRGRVHVIASHSQLKDSAGIKSAFLHEVIGHHGLRGWMEQLSTSKQKDFQKEFNSLMDQVYESFKDDSRIQSLRRGGYERRPGQSEKAFQRELAEELIAHEAQEGTSPDLVDKLISWFRKIYRELTGKVLKLNDSEIRNIIGNARKFVKVGDSMVDRAPLRATMNPGLMQRSNPSQMGMFGQQADSGAATKRMVLKDQLNTATKRLAQLRKLPMEAKSNLVKDEIAALQKDVIRINNQLADTLRADQARAGGEQQSLFQRVLPDGIKKVGAFKTDEGKFSYYDTESMPRGRAQMFTVHEDKNGWTVRNVILPEDMRGKGIATQVYEYLNQESINKTGVPLRSSRPRTLSTGETLTELSKDGQRLWDRLVSQGKAVKTGDKLYEFIETPILFQRAPATDTKAFKDWFGDSKVVDENGEPLVVYHGTKDSFDEFKSREGRLEGFYFSGQPEYANTFAGFDNKKQKIYPVTMEHMDKGYPMYPNIVPVYLSIKNPLILNEDQKDVIEDIKYWDGIYNSVKEGGYDGVMTKDGEQYFVFSPTQIKSATGNVGTFDPQNPDIRFQRAKPIEESGDLVAMHNISFGGLLNAAKIGGLPMPSLAITRRDLQFENFGNISLVADKSLIDPKVRGNRTFGADIYSPRYPSVNYMVKEAELQKMFGKDTEGLPDDWQLKIGKLQNDIEDRAAAAMKNNYLVKVAYLKEQGKKMPELQQQEKPFVSKALLDYFDKKNAEDSQWKYHDFKFDGQFKKLVSESKMEAVKGSPEGERGYYKKLYSDPQPHVLSDVIREIEENKSTRVKYKTSEWFRAIDDMLPYGSKEVAKFEAWVDDQYSKLDVQEKMFAGTTPSGTKRFIPHNIENVMKMLKKESLQAGEGFSYGVGTARAAYTPQFKSIADIRKSKDKLVSEKDFEKIKEEIDNDFFRLTDKLAPFYSGDATRFGYNDTVINLLVDARRNGIERELKAYGFNNVTSSAMEDLYEFTEKLRNFPTEYFESKPNRIVDLGEFRAAVVPKDAPQSVLNVLQDYRVPMEMYDPEVDGDRQAKLNDLLDRTPYLRFQRSPVYFSPSEQSLQWIAQDKGTPEQWKKMMLSKGANEAELNWMGWDDFVKDNPKPTKQQILDWMADNKVEIVEVVKGENDPNPIYEIREVDGKFMIWNDVEQYYEQSGLGVEMKFPERIFAEQQVRIMRKNFQGGPKYSQYQLPGGTGYREVLLTVPSRTTNTDGYTATRGEGDPASGPIWEVRDPQGKWVLGVPIANVATKEEAIERAAKMRRSDYLNYKSSHWDEPNILAHIRMNDRTDSDGRRVLFIEELQSDWAQEGKKKGFKATTYTVKNTTLEKDNKNYILKYNGVQIYKFPLSIVREGMNDSDFHESIISDIQEGAVKIDEAAFVPNMPFPQTSQWLNLSIRRVIRMAAEEGYDSVAFINGEQSADRYDLSKQVDTIVAEKTKKGDWKLEIIPVGSNQMDTQYIKEDALADTIGKELAERIVSDGGGKYSGLDLKVGGEGMKAFYDSIIPAQAKKVLAKIDKDVKVGVVGMRHFSPHSSKDDWKGQQLSFPITPTIHSKVLDLGIPMFQRSLVDQPTKYGDRMTNLQRKWLDRFVDLKLLQEKKSKGQLLADEINAYQEETRSHGRIEEAMKQFQNYHVLPMEAAMKEIFKTGVTYDELTSYLKGKHAPETAEMLLTKYATLKIMAKEKNKEAREEKLQAFKDSLKGLSQEDKLKALEKASGMKADSMAGVTMDNADVMVKTVEDRVPKEKLDKLWETLNGINKFSLEKQLESGLISKERFDSVSQMYQFYVPLRGFKDAEYDPTIFTGDAEATGRESESGDPLAYMMAMAQTAIEKGENNKVRQAFLDFIRQYPDSEIYRIKNSYFVKTDKVEADENGIDREVWEEVTEQPSKEDYERGVRRSPDVDNTIIKKKYFERETLTVMENGRKVTIEFYEPQIARAFKKMDVQKMPEYLGFLSKYMKALSGLYTQYSPEFIITNPLRDLITGIINIRADYGNQVAGEVFSRVGGAFNAMRKAIWSNDYSGKYGTYVQQFIEDGSLTGYSDLSDVTEWTSKLKTTMEGLQGKGTAWQWTKDMIADNIGAPIDKANRITENTMRLAAYITLRERGVSRPQSAAYAKNVTVNFNRRGNAAGAVGTFYLFFNAAIQGSSRIVQPFLSEDRSIRKRAWQTAMALPALSIAMGIFNRFMGGEDDEGEYYYDKLSTYARQHNFVIAIGENNFIQIPLPYGFNVFFAIPDHIVRAGLGYEKPLESALNSLSVALNSFSPLGAPELGRADLDPAAEALRLGAPTAAKPLLDYALNENFAGYPIFKENFGNQTPKPDSEMYFANVNPMIRDFTSWANTITGGDEVVPGAIDVNPESIEHFVSSYGGGVYSFVNNTVTTGAMIASGNNPITKEGDKYKKVPFIRRFVNSASEYVFEREFYMNAKEVQAKNDFYNRYKKSGDPKRAQAYRKENMAFIQLQNLAESTQDRAKSIDERIARMEDMPQNNEVKTRIKELQDQRNELFKNFNLRYNQVTKEGKGLSLNELIGG